MTGLCSLIEEGADTQYYDSDHLSVRAVSDSAGSLVGERGHYPFGESWYTSGVGDKWQFTSYERDGESGLDYAMFRYDSSRLGRFMTPDPLAGSLLNPQSLNGYAYVRNDPVNLIDPLGLFAWPPVEWFMNYYSGEIDPWHLGGGGAPNCHWECVQICFVDGEGKRRCQEENCRYVCDNPFDASLGSCQGLGCLSGHPPLMIDRNIDWDWWSAFAREFFRGTNRRLGESFWDCLGRTMNETTFGLTGKVAENAREVLGGISAAGTMGLASQLRVPIRSAPQLQLTVAQVSGATLGMYAGLGAGGARAVAGIFQGIGAASAKAIPVAAAAGTGLVAGSALNCLPR